MLQKTKDRYHNCGGKEKAAECQNCKNDVLKENAYNKYRNLPEKKEAKREYGKNRYRNMKENPS